MATRYTVHLFDKCPKLFFFFFWGHSLVHFWQITKYSREPILTFMWTVAARSDNCNGHIIDFIFIVTGICFMILANHSSVFRNIDQQEVEVGFWNDGVNIFINHESSWIDVWSKQWLSRHRYLRTNWLLFYLHLISPKSK